MKIYFSITFSSYTNLSRKANHFPVYFFAPANVSEILILSPNIAFRDRLWYTVVAEADFQNRRSKNERSNRKSASKKRQVLCACESVRSQRQAFHKVGSAEMLADDIERQGLKHNLTKNGEKKGIRVDTLAKQFGEKFTKVNLEKKMGYYIPKP